MTKRKKRLLKNEVQILHANKLVIRTEVAQYVTQILKKKLFYVSPVDQMHLLKLQIWSEKYQVPVRYILDVLLEYYGQWMKRFKSARGLGVKIPTLTGQRSRKILLEKIAQDFPDGENKILYRRARQEEIIQSRLGLDTDEEDDLPTERRKTVLDFANPRDYAKYYSQSIKATRNQYAKVLGDENNKRRPYRGNPWI